MTLGSVSAALAAVICFAVVLLRSGVIAIAAQVPKTATAGVTTMLDASLSDEAKEKAVQAAGLALLRQSWQVAWRLALALVAVAAPIYLFDLLGVAPSEATFGVLLRIDFLVIVSVAAIGLGWVWRRRSRPLAEASGDKISDANAYSSGDRLMHAMAFSGLRAQIALSRLDDRLYRKRIASVADAPPIFITSLARGGTTALLRALHDHPQIATHRYSDMPFLSAPLLWDRLAGRRAGVASKERAHGDGIKIDLQSPEAFDEVFWMLFWPEKYRADRIELWGPEDGSDTGAAFLAQHFRKIAAVRHREAAPDAVRYLSKNNANIARLGLLPKLFPGCQVVVPLREPTAHAASLHRQHQNFLKLHGEDAFSKRYMRNIGHFEFGDLHRPMAFDLDALSGHEPKHPDYWLAYWITCFEHIAGHADRLTLIAQDTLRAAPEKTMEALLARLNLPNSKAGTWGEVFLHRPDAQMDDLFDPALVKTARDIYAALHAKRLGR